jgi:hypothetical protein
LSLILFGLSSASLSLSRARVATISSFDGTPGHHSIASAASKSPQRLAVDHPNPASSSDPTFGVPVAAVRLVGADMLALA